MAFGGVGHCLVRCDRARCYLLVLYGAAFLTQAGGLMRFWRHRQIG
tara:strand:- start:2145 stop:2282 length:138 start_codon:yes stop_codon:yes gene_type:complete